MSAFKDANFNDRLGHAASAKKAELEKFRAKAEVDEKVLAEREAARREIIAARDLRAKERKVAQEAKDVRDAAEKAERDAILKAQKEARDLESSAEAERAAALEVERKKARDARYAARKARK
jgi:hypothetical protein